MSECAASWDKTLLRRDHLGKDKDMREELQGKHMVGIARAKTPKQEQTCLV